jgi:3-oxoacyl-[acyl-carrier protein] reductase
MIVLITGGSSGLGEAITRKFAADASNTVYFTYYQSAANAQKISADHPNAIAIKCNIKDDADVTALKEQMAQFNPDVLVNNAYTGAFMKNHFHKTPAEDFLTDFKNNIIPTIALTQAAITGFRKKKSGKIITILTSALVNVAPAGAAAYVANKAYLAQMAKVWASENAKYHITSNTVSPSFMATSFTKDTDERIIDQMTQDHPLKQLLTTAEVADSVYFLANATEHLNGIDIVINAATSLK